MYKKKFKEQFEKDGYAVYLLDVDYNDVSICLVEVNDFRKTLCKIKNSPIYYYVIEGSGIFSIKENLKVTAGDLIEIPLNEQYTYSGT